MNKKSSIRRSCSRVKLSQEQIRIGRNLAQILVSILEHERKVEERREALCELKDFEPFSKYHHILRYATSTKNKGSIDGSCLKRFLMLNNLSSTASDCLALEYDRMTLFHKQFHSSNPKVISYIEFLRFLLPNYR